MRRPSLASGTWGDNPQFLPTRHGFDRYFGLPYSNDMWPNHPTKARTIPPLPLIEGEKVIETNARPDAAHDLVHRAGGAVHRRQQGPAVLPVSAAQHAARAAVRLRQVQGQDRAGPVRRRDRRDRLERRADSGGAQEARPRRATRSSFFSSDNGPWLSYGNHAGSAGPLREGKGTTWDGGHLRADARPLAGQDSRRLRLAASCAARSTCCRRSPSSPAAKRRRTGSSTAATSGRCCPASPDAKTPHEAFYYYWDYGLEAVRSGPWKLHLPHEYRSLAGAAGKDGQPGPYKQAKTELALYNLADDVGETKDVSPPSIPTSSSGCYAHAERPRGPTWATRSPSAKARIDDRRGNFHDRKINSLGSA